MQFSRGGPRKQKAKIVIIVTKVTTSSGTVMNLELIPVVIYIAGPIGRILNTCIEIFNVVASCRFNKFNSVGGFI